jgi:hypothetical protein
VEVSLLKVSFTEVCPSQVRLVEVSLLKVSFTEVRPSEI